MISQNTLVFSTKGETLQKLQGSLAHAIILNGVLLSYTQFQSFSEEQAQAIFCELGSSTLIVRSNCSCEDLKDGSQAGRFTSVSNVSGYANLKSAINTVFESYTRFLTAHECVYIQPQLCDIKFCGVIFSCVPHSQAPYVVISESNDGQTDTVTAGESNNFNTYYIAEPKYAIPHHQPLCKLLNELKTCFPIHELDIEYAITSSDEVVLLQVRPLVVSATEANNDNNYFRNALSNLEKKLDSIMGPHPYLSGHKSILGVMPDWNPAEIIGLRPKPLSLSLYKDLITDSTWAYQRNNYGYRNLRSFPLMIDLLGLPYIDVRTSFNSFIPNDLPEELSEKLVNHYLAKLEKNPSSHDKVEFDIVLSCYSLDIQASIQDLQTAGFQAHECQRLSDSLRRLTNTIINPHSGLWIQDLHKIEKLKERQSTVMSEIQDPIQRIYWLLEDCKRYGTLPFAGLARAGFIAVQLLRSLVSQKILTPQEYQDYLLSLRTVTGEFTSELHLLDKKQFLEKYGHLRPGTYDINSHRYDSKPDIYFDWGSQVISSKQESKFEFNSSQYSKLHQLLNQHGINHSVDSFFHFISSAIEGREFAKFIFTKSLSDAIEEIAKFGESFNIGREDMAYCDITELKTLIGNASDPSKLVRDSIQRGKHKQALAERIHLPALITTASDIFAFRLLDSEPNFVTNLSISAQVESCDMGSGLYGKIVCIPSADPGYDWLFSKGIAGLITEFGGSNSHMAIRANELGLPAAIGCGQQLYDKWKKTKRLQLDCANKKVTILA